MYIRLLGPDDFRAMPWGNGLGTTVEMAREDDPSGAMLWRVSAANVVEAGPFSVFPGVDRILTLIEGPGFDLDFSRHGRAAPVELFGPVAFSGDWSTSAESVRGPSRDLNVMTARGKASADVHILQDTAPTAAFGDRTLIFCATGNAILTIAGTAHSIETGHLALISGAKGLVGALSANQGTVVQVDIAFTPTTP